MTGRSYGGYLTLAMLAFSPGTFAAGVDICGMSDLHTFYRDTEPWIASAAVTKYGDPERDWALLRALSPMQQVANIDVPLLVAHGELDTNVPFGEAKQVVAALRELDRPVELLVLHGEDDEYGDPGHARHIAEAGGGSLAVLPGRGHLPHREDAEDVTRRIAAFLAPLP